MIDHGVRIRRQPLGDVGSGTIAMWLIAASTAQSPGVDHGVSRFQFGPEQDRHRPPIELGGSFWTERPRRARPCNARVATLAAKNPSGPVGPRPGLGALWA